MAVLPILVYPDARLKKISEPVSELDTDTLSFIADLVETLDSQPGCVGIAAPQTGMLKRILVVDASRNRKPVPNHGRLILINPILTNPRGQELAREGCLSLPNLTANVTRAREVTVSALTPDGPVTLEASGFEARVILHEADHLDGLLFLDRVASLATDVFRRKRF